MEKHCASEMFLYIYDKVFSNLKSTNVDLFLCGGASYKQHISYRDKLRSELEHFEQLSILYPEDMFMEMLNKKKYDLLTLEKFLANNSDIILIVCESAGSFTELGAFVNNNDTFEKVVILLQSKYKNAKSFIRQGPVEYVKSKNKNNVIYYNKNFSDVVPQIKNSLNSKFGIFGYRKKSISLKDLNLISGQYNFILILLYFYRTIKIKELVGNIRDIYIGKSFSEEYFEIVYSSAVRRLFKEGMIKKVIAIEGENQYELTDKGYIFSKSLLSSVAIEKRTKVFDQIRMKIINKDINN